jgi:hypothetical protein
MTVKTGVIYLQKDKFQMYSPYLRQIVELRFTPEMVLDLDVLNDELLEQQIKAFVTNGKITPSNLVIVLSDNAYFVKDFALQAPPSAQPPKPGQPPVPAPKVSLDDLKPQIDLFIEHVPYENVVSKTFPLKNGMRVCAVNQDLYKTVQRAFEKVGFKVDSVLPGMVLGGGLSAKTVLDGVLANTALQKASSLKQYDLLPQEAFSPVKKVEEQVDEVQDSLQNSKEPPKTDKKRMIAMLGVLGVLLVILVVVFIQSQQPPPPPSTAVQQPALANQPTVMPPIATATVIQPTEVVTVSQTQNLKVQIVTTSDTNSVAQTLKTALNSQKFANIVTQTQNNAGSATTIVSFSGSMSQGVRNIVLDEVRKLKTDVRVQEIQSGTNDVTIILGK